MKKLIVVLVAMVCLTVFTSQAAADRIKVEGTYACYVAAIIEQYFPEVTDYIESNQQGEFRGTVVLFLDDKNNILAAYPIDDHMYNSFQTVPPVVLACVQVLLGQESVWEYRIEKAADEEMTERHSSGYDVHKYVPKYTVYAEVVDRCDGYTTIKYTVASDNWRVCFSRKENVPMGTHHTNLPRGWFRLPLDGDGSITPPDDVKTKNLYGPTTGWGGY